MRQIPSIELILAVLQALVCLSLGIRIWRSDLVASYRYFFSFLIFTAFISIGALFLPFGTNLYRNVFVTAEILTLAFNVMMVQEVFSAVLRDLTGLATAARKFIAASVSAAFLVSLGLLFLDRAPVTLTGRLFVFEQGIMVTLLFFVLFISGFLVYYPVSLKRNVIFYSIGYAFYFLAKAAILFSRNAGAQHRGQLFGRGMSTFLLFVSVGSLIFWLCGITQKGNQTQAVIGHIWNPADEERLLAQLRIINDKVLSSGHRAS